MCLASLCVGNAVSLGFSPRVWGPLKLPGRVGLRGLPVASCEPLGGFLEPLVGFLGRLGSLLGASWGFFRASWEPLAASCGPLGGMLGIARRHSGTGEVYKN